jgi:hypothetical protein
VVVCGRRFSKLTGTWLAATDFTTIEVWTPSGLVTVYLLFVMELKNRRVHFAGMTPNPDETGGAKPDRLRSRLSEEQSLPELWIVTRSSVTGQSVDRQVRKERRS